MFQWTGGWLQGTTINSNVGHDRRLNAVALDGVFYNSGLVRHTNTATLAIRSNAHFENQAGGTYDLEGDGGIAWVEAAGWILLQQLSACCARAAALGPRRSVFIFYNQNGSIEVDSGQLSLSGQ